MRAAEADATLNEFGVMTPAWAPLNAARNWYPKVYQRFPEILRKLGASGLMTLPTEADIAGPAAGDIEDYLQSAARSGPERVRLFRLAWDLSISAFAGRQTLYEYYFFGDPVRMAGALVGSLRPRAVQGAHQRVPAPRGRRGPRVGRRPVSRWRPRSPLRPPSPADRRRPRRAGSATPR